MLIKEDSSKGMKYFGYKSLETMSITAFAEQNHISVEDVYNKYANKIFQTTNAQSSIRKSVMNETMGLDYPMVGCEYIPIKGKNEGKRIEILYKGEQRRMMMFLSDYVERIGDEYYYLDRVSNLWDDIDYNNLSKEGGLSFLMVKTNKVNSKNDKSYHNSRRYRYGLLFWICFYRAYSYSAECRKRKEP